MKEPVASSGRKAWISLSLMLFDNWSRILLSFDFPGGVELRCISNRLMPQGGNFILVDDTIGTNGVDAPVAEIEAGLAVISKRDSVPEEQQPIDPELPNLLREFHAEFPLEGSPPNLLLGLPDDQLLYLVALIRNSQREAPMLSLEEWKCFLRLLSSHGIYALIAYHLHSWPADCQPPLNIRYSLDRHFLHAAAKAMQMGRQLQIIGDALEMAGIPSAILKGPALARTVYQHPALRQSGDIDILVRREDFVAAESVLETLGYDSPRREFHTSKYAYHQEFIPRSNGLMVEIHWALDCGYRLVSDGWAERAIERRRPFVSGDLHAHALDPIDDLPYLALHHGFQHSGLRLDQIADICMLMSRSESLSESGNLISEAMENRLMVPLDFAVRAAILWGGNGLIKWDAEATNWQLVEGKEVRIWRHMKARQTSAISSFFTGMNRESGALNKARFGYQFVLPPRHRMIKYRKSQSSIDVPLAHLRRWLSIGKNM